MLDRIRTLTAYLAFRLAILAMVGLAFGGMYHLPTNNLLALKIPVYIALSAGACFVVVLCCDILLAGQRAMTKHDSNSITEITGERPR